MIHPFLRLWWDTGVAAQAAGITIAARTARMATAILSGDPSGGPERRRMVSEKLAAADAGFRALARHSPLLILARPQTGSDLMALQARLAAAFLAPGYGTARRNARRLTRPRGR